MDERDVSHLQRFIWGHILYPALCAGLTSYALCFASSSCQRTSFPLRSAQRTFVSELTLHLVPLYFAFEVLHNHALPALTLSPYHTRVRDKAIER